jgi:uncharacterized protein YqeY
VSDLLPQLQSDLNAARKAQDKLAVLLLGTVLADLKNRQLELQHDLSDDEAREVLRKAVKRRRESVEMYRKGGRAELAEKEQTEIGIIERYLPPAVSEDDLRAAVRTAIDGGATNIGAVMGKVVPQFKGRAEGSSINAIAREELARKG